MKPYQQSFIEFALKNEALRFGEFILKSGRISPYFFNAGMFRTGQAFYHLGQFYADAILEAKKQGLEFDILFGPAYKGIQLATCASIGLHVKAELNIPVCFNRKEAKDHGEGGIMVGESIKDKRLVMIDDVITAGTTVRQSIDLIKEQGGKLVGIIIALNRQEKGLESNLSAIQEVEKNLGIPVISIITRDNLIEYLDKNAAQLPQAKTHLGQLKQYREQYGVA